MNDIFEKIYLSWNRQEHNSDAGSYCDFKNSCIIHKSFDCLSTWDFFDIIHALMKIWWSFDKNRIYIKRAVEIVRSKPQKVSCK
jgi:hypothetical protein